MRHDYSFKGNDTFVCLCKILWILEVLNSIFLAFFFFFFGGGGGGKYSMLTIDK